MPMSSPDLSPETNTQQVHMACVIQGRVPNEVVQRADSVLEDIHSKKPVRRVTSEKLTATDKQYQDAVTKLMAFDTQKDDLNSFFQELFPSEF